MPAVDGEDDDAVTAARARWNAALPAEDRATLHAYLRAKKVTGRGMRVESQKLLVPVRSVETGDLIGLQVIGRKDGKFSKKFTRGTRIAEHTGVFSRGKYGGTVWIVEGVADCKTVATATGSLAVCAFGAPNLERVATAVRGKWPKAKIVVVADNDEPGLRAANEAAAASGAKVVIPRGERIKDINDVLVLRGAKAVRRQLRKRREPTASPKGRDAAVQLETDFANADRLIRRHQDNIRYSTERGWLAFDGQRWRPNSDPDVQELAKETVRGIYGELAGLQGTVRDQRYQWAKRSESAARVASMIKMAHSDRRIRVRIDQLDADPMLFNVRNGTVDLRTGELLPHRRENLITRLADANYDETARCERWLEFLHRVFRDDEEVIRFVRRFVGYAMTGHTREQVLLLAYGSGANGKSVFIETLRGIFADYGASVAIDSLAARKRSPGNASADLARLVGRRLVSVSEIPESLRLNEAMVKDLTGGDTISARNLYEQPFDFRPAFKLLLRANHKPEITGTDEGIWRRVRLLPFEVTIPRKERDLDLTEKLFAERSGILNWAIEGCRRWQDKGLGCPKAVRVATEQYRTDMDVIGTFLTDAVKREKHAKVGATHLYQKYRAFAEGAGEEPVSQKSFGAAMTLRGMKRAKANRGFVYHGLDVR